MYNSLFIVPQHSQNLNEDLLNENEDMERIVEGTIEDKLSTIFDGEVAGEHEKMKK